MRQKLSESFIKKYENRVDWKSIIYMNVTLSKDLKENLNICRSRNYRIF
jgi:hypothetical protein